MMKMQANNHRTHWFRNTLCVLIACSVIGTVLSAILYLNNPGKTYASTSIQFSFDGAAEGTAPNGYAFNISAVASDEVLEKALADAGMADKYTPENIRAQIETTGVYPEDIVNQMMTYESLLDFSANRTLTLSDYHPTLYTVNLYNGFDPSISRENLEKLLRAVLDSYKAFFSEVYTAGKYSVALSYNLEEFDYPQQLTILTRTIEESITYANEIYEKEPALTLNGQGFNDISVRLNNLIETDISRLSANITMNALTKDTSRLITQYDYEILKNTNELNKKNEQLVRLDALISSYEKNEIIYLSTSDSLTKIDGNSSETYDELVATRREVADELTTISNEIAKYHMLLADLINEEETDSAVPANTPLPAAMDSDTADSMAEEIIVPERTQEEIDALAKAAEEASAKQIAALEKDILDLESKREAIMKEFADLVQLYNEKRVNDMTVSVFGYRYQAPSLFSGSFIKQTIKIVGMFCVIGFVICMILLINSRRKEEKLSMGNPK